MGHRKTGHHTRRYQEQKTKLRIIKSKNFIWLLTLCFPWKSHEAGYKVASISMKVLKALHYHGGEIFTLKALFKLWEEIHSDIHGLPFVTYHRRRQKNTSQAELLATSKYTHLQLKNDYYVGKERNGLHCLNRILTNSVSSLSCALTEKYVSVR